MLSVSNASSWCLFWYSHSFFYGPLPLARSLFHVLILATSLLLAGGLVEKIAVRRDSAQSQRADAGEPHLHESGMNGKNVYQAYYTTRHHNLIAVRYLNLSVLRLITRSFSAAGSHPSAVYHAAVVTISPPSNENPKPSSDPYGTLSCS